MTTSNGPSAATRWRCIVTWTYSEEIVLEAGDADEARATAIEHTMDQHPFADDYGLAWAPEEVAS